MQRKKTLAYETKVARGSADKPDSVAPASGIRLVRPPIATLPGASSVPPPPSAMPRSAPPVPEKRAVARTLPLGLAPAAAPAPAAKTIAKSPPVPALPKAIANARALVTPASSVPPPPPSGLRARGLSSAPPPPSRRPPRPEPQMLDDDSVVEDADDASELLEVEATLTPPLPSARARRSSAPPRPVSPSKLPSLKATGQNWPRVEWPRLDAAATPKPPSVRPSAPPRPTSSPPPSGVRAVIEEAAPIAPEAPADATSPVDVVAASTAHAMPTAAEVDAALQPDAGLRPILGPAPTGLSSGLRPDGSHGRFEGEEAVLPVVDDVIADAAPALPRHTEMVPPPPGAGDLELDPGTTTSLVYDEDPVDFRPESPLVRLGRALGQARPILAWLDANPRAFASVGFGAGVVVALFVALLVS